MIEAPLIEFLAPYPPEVQELALQGRKRLLELVGPASEIFWDATQAVCAGFTYTAKVSDNFVNLAVYPKHVTLIFPNGARQQDPEARLGGEGSRVRHIRLASIDTLSDPYVVDQIEQAKAIAPRPATPIDYVVHVKVMNGPKRRPKPS
jgi:hypothetical protein